MGVLDIIQCPQQFPWRTNMTKKDLEMKLKETLEELSGLKEIYKDGISKKELRMFALKWTVIGIITGAILGHLVL